MLKHYYPELSVTRGEDEDTVMLKPTVEYYYSPGAPGRRERGSGLALEPDEAGVVDIVSVTLNNAPLILSAREFSELEDEILESESGA